MTGRIFYSTNHFIINHEGKELYHNDQRMGCEYHPNLTVPVMNKDLQSDIDETLNHLFNNIKQKNDLDKYHAVIRSIKAYRNSLRCSLFDLNLAYILLFSSAEAIAEVFCKRSPQIQDIPQFKEIENLFTNHQISEEIKKELYDILYKPKHLKKQAKFIGLIEDNLSADFFEKRFISYCPVAKDIKQIDGKMMIDLAGFEEYKVDFFMKKEQLGECLKNLYNCRSEFVHDAIVWPAYANIKHSSIYLFQPNETDQYGKPKKNKDGSFKLKKPIPSYYCFERIMNNVIKNIILKLGKDD